MTDTVAIPDSRFQEDFTAMELKFAATPLGKSPRAQTLSQCRGPGSRPVSVSCPQGRLGRRGAQSPGLTQRFHHRVLGTDFSMEVYGFFPY